MSYIYLSDGGRFYFADPVFPKAEVFAHSLALINRYTGHTVRPYSVAEHSVHLWKYAKIHRPMAARALLIHDFSEIFMMDMVRPLKPSYPQYVEDETNLQRKIFAHFNEPWENMELVHDLDRGICGDEIGTLWPCPMDHGIVGLGIDIPTRDIGWREAKTAMLVACAEEGIH